MAKIKFDPQKYRPIANHGHPDLNQILLLIKNIGLKNRRDVLMASNLRECLKSQENIIFI